MQVSIETTAGLERRMTITLPADQFDAAVNQRLEQAARQVRLPGFRPGKVPMREVRRRFGPGVRQEVAGELMQSSFFEAVQGEKLQPAGMPRFEPQRMEQGFDFEYTATFEIFPEIALADFGQVQVSRPQAEVTDADIDTMIERLREQRQEFVADEQRKAEDGDEVTLDFTGYLGDEPFEGGKAEDAKIVLGSGRMIPGFEDALQGLAAGDEKSFEVTFPEDYGNEQLKGQQARFDVTIKAVAVADLPELDDAFFAQFGVEEGGIDAFREDVRRNMERELRQAVKTRVKNQVMEALAGLHEVTLPVAMVDEEIHRMQHEMVQQFGGQGMDPHALPRELFKDQAERRVKLGLVVNRIVEANELSADAGRVQAILEEVAAPYSDPEQVINWYHSNPEQMQQIRSAALEEQVVDLVLDAAEVTDEPCSYDEALAAARANPAQDAADEDADADDQAEQG